MCVSGSKFEVASLVADDLFGNVCVCGCVDVASEGGVVVVE